MSGQPLSQTISANEIIELLELHPHPERGHYRETFRDNASGGDDRAASTAIYFLLKADEVSHWHRIDGAEVWHYYAGAPLALRIFENGAEVKTMTLGSDLSSGARPQIVVPPHAWQSAKSLGNWTLVGCTVAPGFEFGKFELAPKDWEPEVEN